jgi:hypothetical protein
MPVCGFGFVTNLFQPKLDNERMYRGLWSFHALFICERRTGNQACVQAGVGVRFAKSLNQQPCIGVNNRDLVVATSCQRLCRRLLVPKRDFFKWCVAPNRLVMNRDRRWTGVVVLLRIATPGKLGAVLNIVFGCDYVALNSGLKLCQDGLKTFQVG